MFFKQFSVRLVVGAIILLYNMKGASVVYVKKIFKKQLTILFIGVKLLNVEIVIIKPRAVERIDFARQAPRPTV